MENLEKKLENLNVLIVDDNDKNIQAYKEAIKELEIGFKITYANSKNQAMERLQKEKYDLVITDRIMETEFSGHELFKYCFDNRIKAYMVTEFEHSGKLISVSPLEENKSVRGSKTNPEKIKKVINIISSDFKKPCHITGAIKRFEKFNQKKIKHPLYDKYKRIKIESLFSGSDYLKNKTKI